jgi:hypothetical protein
MFLAAIPRSTNVGTKRKENAYNSTKLLCRRVSASEVEKLLSQK